MKPARDSLIPPGRGLGLGAALLLALGPACSIAGRPVAEAGPQTVSVAEPAPGKVNAALLSFALEDGAPAPGLRLVNSYRQPPSAAFVAGVARDGADPNRYLGLVAIANFKPSKSPGHRIAGAEIAANRAFIIEFAGDAGHASSATRDLEALSDHGPWTLDWFRQPTAVPEATRALAGDGGRLLDAITGRMKGASRSDFVDALAGRPVSDPNPDAGSPAPTAANPGVRAAPTGAPVRAGAGARAGGRGATGPANPAGGRRSASSAATAEATMPIASPGPSPSPATPPAPIPSPDPTPTPSPSPGPGPGSGMSDGVTIVQRGPESIPPGTSVSVTGTCPDGMVVTGGGAHLTVASGETPSNSLHLDGMFPSDPDGALSGDGAHPDSWTAAGGAAGQPMTDAVTTDLVMCGDGEPDDMIVVVAGVPGPSAPASSVAVTASCPAGRVLVGGGGNVTVPPGTGPNNPSLKLIGSYPSDRSGAPTRSGSANAWTAVGGAGGGQIVDATTTAFALCRSSGGPAANQVIAVSVPGPETPGAPATVTASCPSGTTLLSGGVNIDRDAQTPQQGLHLRGSYPSDRSGAQAGDRATAGSWTAVVQTGGQPAPGTRSTAFAICTP